MNSKIMRNMTYSLFSVYTLILLIVLMVSIVGGCANDSEDEHVENLEIFGNGSEQPEPIVDNDSFQAEMVPIQGGSFYIGDSACMVKLSPFSMSKYEVTYEQWEEVRKWAELNGYVFDNPGDMGSSDNSTHSIVDGTHPVTDMNWYDAVKWCNALSLKEGLKPCYYISSAKTTVYTSGQIDLENDWVDWESNGYRLPTEAEWEYACRANTSTKYNFGDTLSGVYLNYRNSGDEYDSGTTPVGYYPANPWGLFDMHGNVREWCWDVFEAYPSDSQVDPRGFPTIYDRLARVARGGCFQESEPWYLESTLREYDAPKNAFIINGFRLVQSY